MIYLFLMLNVPVLPTRSSIISAPSLTLQTVKSPCLSTMVIEAMGLMRLSGGAEEPDGINSVSCSSNLSPLL